MHTDRETNEMQTTQSVLIKELVRFYNFKIIFDLMTKKLWGTCRARDFGRYCAGKRCTGKQIETDQALSSQW